MQVDVAPTPASTGTQHGAAREARTASYPKGADQPAAGDHPATDHPATDHPNEAAPRTKRWIPGLDGLRAIAVIAVVLFHLNPDYLSGGFLGVDLFFVISGYLITRLLVAEHQRTGRISIGRFYLRRARRLLPAVALLLAVVSVAGGLIWRDQRPTLAGGLFSSMGYVTNWWLIGDHQSYFVAMGRPPMLQHLCRDRGAVLPAVGARGAGADGRVVRLPADPGSGARAGVAGRRRGAAGGGVGGGHGRDRNRDKRSLSGGFVPGVLRDRYACNGPAARFRGRGVGGVAVAIAAAPGAAMGAARVALDVGHAPAAAALDRR